MTSFELDLTKRNYIAKNNLKLNAVVSTILLITQIFPIFMPWYGDPNYEYDPNEKPSSLNIIGRYRNKS